MAESTTTTVFSKAKPGAVRPAKTGTKAAGSHAARSKAGAQGAAHDGPSGKPTPKAKGSARAKAPSPEERHRMIAEQAYLRAERRGFQGGDMVDDWLAAEAEVDHMLSRRKGTSL